MQIAEEEALIALLKQEIGYFRDILANLKLEHHARVQNNFQQLSQLIDGRLDILDEWEKTFFALVKITGQLAAETGQQNPESHKEILEILDAVINSEEIELCSLIAQDKALIDEIHCQNSIIKYHTENVGNNPFAPSIGQHLVPILKEKQKKIRLEVLDPPV